MADSRNCWWSVLCCVLLAGIARADDGTPPVDARGKPLNVDFETGTLADWTATGNAFAKQPIDGDSVSARRGDMRSDHVGRYWIGTFERGGDEPQGTLTSAPFKITHPYASFRVGGGQQDDTRVELVLRKGDKVFFKASGDNTENLKPVMADLRPQQGEEMYIRLVDKSSGGWGHLNFDHFRFHKEKPNFPTRVDMPAPDVYAHAGLSPTEAAKDMTVPEGFSVTLFAGEPDVKQPIAFCLDDRGRIWVAEAYSYPIRLPANQAHDRILIFEDTDGDGHFDKRTVFADKLNLVSGLEVGFGGVWVGAAPNLMFIPDKNGDDVPDGPPEILLDGWAYQDTHETLNTFMWGPDGWLYGCHGVFTFSNVGKPGAKDSERTPINAGIWRYHPTRRQFEVFAEGTSNPWGIDFNDRGQLFETACVIPHLFHMIQGGRYTRQAGPHANPYTYDDITTIAKHRHYVGANPHGGNGRSDSAGGGHAHAGAMIYLADAWPEKYRDQIFMNNIHGARINQDAISPQGSGYVGDRAPDFLLANDSWSQILNLKYGPDGQVYMIDWYDANQCHRPEANLHDRTNGRVFKVTYGKAKPVTVDLAKMSDEELIKQQLSPNDWYVRHARRLLQERGANPKLHAALAELAFQHKDETRQLRGLWALQATGGLTAERVMLGLENSAPYVRAWTIQLALDGQKPSPEFLARLAELALSDPSPVVRLYLASAAGRLPLADRWKIAAGLVTHAEDAGDHNLPLMYWYACEPLAEANIEAALALGKNSKIPTVDQFLVRRVAQLGTPEAMSSLVARLGKTEQPDKQQMLLTEVNEALKGRRKVAMPGEWPAVFSRLVRSANGQTRSQLLALAVTFGDSSALTSLREVLVDGRADAGLRQEALSALVKVKDAPLAAVLPKLLTDADLRGPALRAMAAYEESGTPASILAIYAKLSPAERRDALSTLASRPGYATALLEAVKDKRVAATDLSADLIRQMRNLKQAKIDKLISEAWGDVRETDADKAKLIAQVKQHLATPPSQDPDLALGRAMFVKTCAQCHTLFGTGGKVGPELTGSNRANLDYLLSNVLDPSALIGKDYLAHIIQTKDGRVLTGIIRAEDKNAVTLQTQNETVVIPLDEIEARERSTKSMMPDDLLKPLSDHETRSLVAYLASPMQTPLLVTPENAVQFFNGKDLTGWTGDPALWSVDGKEIVGKTAKGLDHNEFLRSDFLAGDFRLSLEVKLVPNEGNSGIQFRSQAQQGPEVHGYQADIGAGWWGKIYEEGGRGLLWDKSGESAVKPGEWNKYEVLAVGSQIRTSINGKPCAELDDADGARRGIFAFQIHAGGPMEVRFRNLVLEPGVKPVRTAGGGN